MYIMRELRMHIGIFSRTRVEWHAEDEALRFNGMLIHRAFVPRRVHGSRVTLHELPAYKLLECRSCAIAKMSSIRHAYPPFYSHDFRVNDRRYF